MGKRKTYIFLAVWVIVVISAIAYKYKLEQTSVITTVVVKSISFESINDGKDKRFYINDIYNRKFSFTDEKLKLDYDNLYASFKLGGRYDCIYKRDINEAYGRIIGCK